MRRYRSTLTVLLITFLTVLATTRAIESKETPRAQRTQTVETETETETEPIVLPKIFDCDSLAIERWVFDLVEMGFTPQGVAANYGEALTDPDNRVVIRFSC